MKKPKKKIAIIGIAILVVGALFLLLVPLPAWSETDGRAEKSVSEAALETVSDSVLEAEGSAGYRALLSNALEKYKQTGQDAMTLREAVPFSWDELRLERGDYTFYQGEEPVYTYRPQEEKNFVLLFNYQVHDTEFLKREEEAKCRLTVRRGVPTLRIYNERYGREHAGQEGIWNTEPVENVGDARSKASICPDGTASPCINGAYEPVYSYDVTVQDSRVADCDNSQVRYFTEDNNKTRDVRGLEGFSCDIQGRPVVHMGGTTPVTSIWNEKKNFWEIKKNKAIESVQNNLGLGTNLEGVTYWEEKDRYTAFCDEWRCCVIFDKKGQVHHKISIAELAESDAMDEMIYIGYEQFESAAWISENVYGFSVCQMDELYSESTEVHRGYFILYDFAQECVIKYFDLQAYQYLVKDGCLYQAMFEGDDFYIRCIDLFSDEETVIPCRNLKLAPTGFQSEIPRRDWLEQGELLKLDVYQKRLYLLTKAGMYRWNEVEKIWYLIMDGTHMAGLSKDRMALKRFQMCGFSEFYVYAQGKTAGESAFYHYIEVKEEPLTQATDDLNIENGAIVRFCGRLDELSKIPIPKGVMRIADGAFEQTVDVPELKNRRRLVLYYKYSRDPGAFKNCVPIKIEMSKFKKTVHAFYFSDIQKPGVQVVLSRKLEKIDAEDMRGQVEWSFYGKVPPKVVNLGKGGMPKFRRMIVPKGSRAMYIKALHLSEYMRRRVVTRT